MISGVKKAVVFLLALALVSGLAGCDKYDFRKARKSGTTEAYREYIRRHPQGRYVKTAWFMIEKSAYARAEQDNTLGSYRAYLSEFPDGKHVAEARREIRILCQRWAQGLSADDLGNARVVFTTSAGSFEFRFHAGAAPGHARNMLALAEEGFYTGLNINMIRKDLIVRFGDPSGDGLGGPGYTIPFEENDLKNVRGAVTMLHTPLDKNTAGSQFVVCLTDIPSYDGKFTVFGAVTEGLETLGRISRSATVEPTGPGSMRPLQPIAIEKVEVKGISLPE